MEKYRQIDKEQWKEKAEKYYAFIDELIGQKAEPEIYLEKETDEDKDKLFKLCFD